MEGNGTRTRSAHAPSDTRPTTRVPTLGAPATLVASSTTPAKSQPGQVPVSVTAKRSLDFSAIERNRFDANGYLVGSWKRQLLFTDS